MYHVCIHVILFQNVSKFPCPNKTALKYIHTFVTRTSMTAFDYTVKSQLSERRLYETTGLFEDDGQSRLFSLLTIAIKLPIMRISIIRKIHFFEVIRRSRLKKMLLNYPSRFEVQMSRMVIIRVLTRILKTGFIESIPGKSWSQN